MTHAILGPRVKLDSSWHNFSFFISKNARIPLLRENYCTFLHRSTGNEFVSILLMFENSASRRVQISACNLDGDAAHGPVNGNGGAAHKSKQPLFGNKRSPNDYCLAHLLPRGPLFPQNQIADALFASAFK
jgi:hypothetical protein